MVEKQKLENIIKRNAKKCKLDHDFYLKKDLKAKQIDNAIERFAQGCNEQDIVAMMDFTIFCSGKEGFVFTDSAFYSHYQKKDKNVSNPLKYEDIATVKKGKRDSDVTFLFKDGSKIEDVYFGVFGPFVIGMMTDILKMDEKQSRSESAAEKTAAQEKAPAEEKKSAKPKRTAPKASAEAVPVTAERATVQTVSPSDAETVKELIEQADNAYYEECDYKQAFNLYMKAAELGSAYACRCVAMCYVDEESVEFDDTKYLEWLNKAISLAKPAAEQGDAEAQCVLGDSLYLIDGDGEETKKQAKQWLLKSAAQGNKSAKTGLKSYFKMKPKAIDAAVQEMAEQLKAEAERKAAEEAAAQAKAEAERKAAEEAAAQAKAEAECKAAEEAAAAVAKAEAEHKAAEEAAAKHAAQPGIAPDENDPMVKMAQRMLDAGKLTHEEISEYSGLPLETIEMLSGPDMNDPMVQMANRLLSSGKLTCEEVAEYSAVPLADVQKLAARQGKNASLAETEKEKAEPEAERKVAEEAAARAKARVEAERKAAEATHKSASENKAENAENLRKQADDKYYYGDSEEAFTLYQKAAELGDAVSTGRVGMCYYNGEGVKENTDLGKTWFRKAIPLLAPAAEKGDAESQYMLGESFYYSDKEDEAKNWFLKSAKQGYEDAKSCLECYFDMTDIGDDTRAKAEAERKAAEEAAARAKAEAERKAAEEAAAKAEAERKAAEEAAARAKAEAERKAAEEAAANSTMTAEKLRLQADEEDNAKNYKEAFPHYLKAAELGDGKAAYRVGWYYFWGFGVEKSNDLQLQWYKKAVPMLRPLAEQGDSYAQYMLGNCLSNIGEDHVSRKEGYIWIYYSSKQQNPSGDAYVHNNSTNMRPYADAYDKVERKATDAGKKLTPAEAVSAILSECLAAEEAAYNRLTPAEQMRTQANRARYAGNHKEAYSLYLKAVEMGDAQAAYEVAELYTDGRGVERNSKLERQWYKKAASMFKPLAGQGDDNAQFMLGKCLLKFEEDEQEGRIWIYYSARQGNSSASSYERHNIDFSAMRLISDALYKVESKAEKAGKKLTPAEEVAAILTVCNNQGNVRVGVIGHIDHGKSTLTAAITKVLALEGRTKAVDVETLDHVSAERECGLSIKTAHVEYETMNRHYSHIDCPNHADYVKNMISGSVQMDGAILVVATTDGIMSQTREHILLAKQIGIPRIVVFMNKIDQVDDEELVDLVEMEIREYLDMYEFDDDECPIIRGSAELALRSTSTDPDAPEYRCIHELLDAMDEYIPLPCPDDEKPFLMPVDDVMTLASRGTVAMGKVARGTLHVAEEVEIVGLKDEPLRTVVTGIEMFRKVVDEARTGDQPGLLMRGVARDTIARGQVLAAVGSIHPYRKFTAQVYVLTKEEGGRNIPFFNNYRPQIVVGAAEVTGIIRLPEGTEMAMPGDNVEMDIKLLYPLALECVTRFSIREGGRTVGVGCVTEIDD